MAEEEYEIVLDAPAGAAKAAGGGKGLIALVLVAVVIVAAGASVYYYRDVIFPGDDNGDGNGNNTNGNNTPPPTFTPKTTIDGPSYAVVNESVTFMLASTNLKNASHAWDFGDDYSNASNPDTGSGPSVDHTYTVAGTYTIVLTTTNATYTATDTLTLSVTSTAPPTLTLQVLESSSLPAPLLPYSKYDILIRVVSTSPDNTTAFTTDTQYVFFENGTEWSDNSTQRGNGTVSDLESPPTPAPQTQPPVGIYFLDLDLDGSLSVNDVFAIEADGGIGIVEGDQFILIYIPQMSEMTEPVGL